MLSPFLCGRGHALKINLTIYHSRAQRAQNVWHAPGTAFLRGTSDFTEKERDRREGERRWLSPYVSCIRSYALRSQLKGLRFNLQRLIQGTYVFKVFLKYGKTHNGVNPPQNPLPHFAQTHPIILAMF